MDSANYSNVEVKGWRARLFEKPGLHSSKCCDETSRGDWIFTKESGARIRRMTAEIQKCVVDAREYDIGMCRYGAGIWRFVCGKIYRRARGRSNINVSNI